MLFTVASTERKTCAHSAALEGSFTLPAQRFWQRWFFYGKERKASDVKIFFVCNLFQSSNKNGTRGRWLSSLCFTYFRGGRSVGSVSISTPLFSRASASTRGNSHQNGVLASPAYRSRTDSTTNFDERIYLKIEKKPTNETMAPIDWLIDWLNVISASVMYPSLDWLIVGNYYQ